MNLSPLKNAEFVIALSGSEHKFTCREDQSLLKGMELCGKRLIPVGCRGGGCGLCKIQVLDGAYRAGKMSRAKVSETEQKSDVMLACRTFPRSNMRIELKPNGVANTFGEEQ